MKYLHFNACLKAQTPPEELSDYLKALWYDANNDWEKAHEIAQEINDDNGSWIHAYLHRKEGDFSNAAYWYRKAGKPVPTFSLREEWEQIATHLSEK